MLGIKTSKQFLLNIFMVLVYQKVNFKMSGALKNCAL